MFLCVSCFGAEKIGINVIKEHSPVFYYIALRGTVAYKDISVEMTHPYKDLTYEQVSYYFPNLHDSQFLGFLTEESKIVIKLQGQELVNEGVGSLVRKHLLSQKITVNNKIFQYNINFSKLHYDDPSIGRYYYYHIDVDVPFAYRTLEGPKE